MPDKTSQNHLKRLDDAFNECFGEEAFCLKSVKEIEAIFRKYGLE